MPWDKGNIALLREEFVQLATRQADVNISQLCQRFHISRKTGYKWLNRAKHMRTPKFTDRKSVPHTQHKKVSNHIKEQIITTRCLHPHWGAKKIKAYLLNSHAADHLPALRTINKILAKEELLRIHQHERHHPYKRFQHTHPNALWQMDFKGYFSLLNGVNCHPLTIIDDCSRFLVALIACENENGGTVRSHLKVVFSHYGLPDAIALDNGSGWSPRNRHHWSEITIWLMQLGIQVIYGKAYHPQSRGKIERLHRTLKTELLNDISMNHLSDAQHQFDLWRHQYNHFRPHEALAMQAPITAYQVSPRKFSDELPPIAYWTEDIIRLVDYNGYILINKRKVLVSKALRGQPVAIRVSKNGESLHIFFCQKIVKTIKNFNGSSKMKRGGKGHNIFT